MFLLYYIELVFLSKSLNEYEKEKKVNVRF